jgi:hypothetical protein
VSHIPYFASQYYTDNFFLFIYIYVKSVAMSAQLIKKAMRPKVVTNLEKELKFIADFKLKNEPP